MKFWTNKKSGLHSGDEEEKEWRMKTKVKKTEDVSGPADAAENKKA